MFDSMELAAERPGGSAEQAARAENVSAMRIDQPGFIFLVLEFFWMPIVLRAFRLMVRH